jgi:hypothetical protein
VIFMTATRLALLLALPIVILLAACGDGATDTDAGSMADATPSEAEMEAPTPEPTAMPDPTPEPTPTQIPDEPITGPVHVWPADGNADDTERGNNGTSENGAAFAEGKVGQAFSLDGVDDFVSLAEQPRVSTAFTIAAWVNLAGDGFDAAQAIFDNGQLMLRKDSAEDGNKFSIFVALADGEMVSPAQSRSAAEADTWTHVGATWDGFVLRVFVDGTPLGGSVRNGRLFDMPSQPRIGGSETGSVDTGPFSGLIDEVRMYNRALTDAEYREVFGEE